MSQVAFVVQIGPKRPQAGELAAVRHQHHGIAAAGRSGDCRDEKTHHIRLSIKPHLPH